MNKKGFTLIELLGVLIVLSIILVVTVPAITSSLKNTDQEKYNNYVKQVLESAEFYVENHREQYPELNTVGNKISFSVSKLIEEGYLKENTIDPSTNKKIDPTLQIFVSVSLDQTFKYQFPAK